MWPFRRKSNIAKYVPERAATSLKIMRTHIAAQAGQLSNLETGIGMLRQDLSYIRQELRNDRDRAEVPPATEQEKRGVLPEIDLIDPPRRTPAADWDGMTA